MEISDEQAAQALLRWYAEMGVDEAVAPQAADLYSWTATKPTPIAQTRTLARPAPNQAAPQTQPVTTEETQSTDAAIAAAEKIAAACDTYEALEAAVKSFEGCPLKSGAKNTVFTDGVVGADLLVIGEAPGRDEDQAGKPFIGRAGQLLDRMLASIGRTRTENTLISNIVFWRPPANRNPTPLETAVCRPFVDRLIELSTPKVILIAGGAPLQALLGITGIMRARGVWREIETANGTKVPTLPTYHPAFLLRQPAGKRLAWADLQSLAERLKDH
ncbi:uracil-DNA glycosylase [Hyphococcus lacteus]|uniref:Type-4 uracil-DNA glycosylase n=1 Tax=Hyphococcus lacteus TaxID=3143536 RepID=A0ABV3Z531_9PROT